MNIAAWLEGPGLERYASSFPPRRTCAAKNERRPGRVLHGSVVEAVVGYEDPRFT
jgi:hypothetical protein